MITARAFDTSCNQGGSAPADVTIVNAGNATFDSTRGAPVCLEAGSQCDSMELLEGRGSLGPEPHSPNTVGGSCADGTEGTYRSSPSLERLVVSRSDGTALAVGKQVTVQATVHASTSYSDDMLDLYVAPGVGAPTWSHVATLSPYKSGLQVLSATYLIPAGERHVLRGVYRSVDDEASACVPGPLNDHDDLVITVGVEPDSTPPSVAITSPTEGATVEGIVLVGAEASDNFGVYRVELYDSGSLVATDDRAPYALSWASRAAPNGSHLLTVRAYDMAGNVATSAPVNVVVNNDHTPPQVAFITPVDGATVEQTIPLEVGASDDRAVARVDFYVDGTLIGGRTTAPFTLSWNARTVSNGPHVLSATAQDAVGNVSALSSVSVVVDNDLIPPETALTAPASGGILSDKVYVEATASDNRQVARVEFYAGGTLIATDTTAPYEVSWDSTAAANGGITLTTKAYDAAGNVTQSAGRAVSVDNAAPTVAITSPRTERRCS